MALIEVTVSELQSASAKIAQANDTFRETAAALKAAAEELSGAWEGPSCEKFVAMQAQLDAWYKMMAECVDGYVKAAQEAAAAYLETDHAAAEIINRH